MRSRGSVRKTRDVDPNRAPKLEKTPETNERNQRVRSKGPGTARAERAMTSVLLVLLISLTL